MNIFAQYLRVGDVVKLDSLPCVVFEIKPPSQETPWIINCKFVRTNDFVKVCIPLHIDRSVHIISHIDEGRLNRMKLPAA